MLIGGTALALQIKHRISEDLDFIYVKSAVLPHGRLRALRERLTSEGWVLRSTPSPALIVHF